MLGIGEFARLGQVSPRTLRHYGDVGVLAPAHVDPATGYRYYEMGQLAELRRVLALRDLGIGLEQVRELLGADGDLSVEQMRGMLRLRQAEISIEIADHEDRLRRVATYLDALERGELMQTIDIVTKVAEPLRLAETTGIAPGYGYDNVHPVFEQRLPAVWERLGEAGIEPGICVAYYDWADDDGRIVVHLGFDIADQSMKDADDVVRVVEMPAVDVASAIHRGAFGDITDTFEALVRWIERNGYRIAERSRELYLEVDRDDPDSNVTELQIPIAR
jgi:DNA-binding transcriptional MerR regulator/effector-binding domain-containing protein